MSAEGHAPPRTSADIGRRRHILGLLALVLAVVFSSAMRIHFALADVNFDEESADGMLKSDPGLIYYVTERILQSGGLPPDDFRADPRIEHPGEVDIPAMFTVGQEFFAAWTYRIFGGEMPLHVFCTWLFGIFASLTAVGVYGLAWELTGRVKLAALAALFFAVLPFNYRTIGMILIREEFSFPLFALHAWLLARAVRTRTTWSFLGAGLALVLALASWHAMGMIVTIEVGALAAWFARTGENPLAVPKAWIVPALAVLACLFVPVLRSKLFLFSIPVMAALAMLAAALLDRRGAWTHGRKVLVAAGAFAALFAVSLVARRWISGGADDYGHVYELILAKLAHGGRLPEDRTELSFGARLIWQGPFATSTWRDFRIGLGLANAFLAASVLAAIPGWVRGRGDAAFLQLSLFALISTVAAWMVRRTLILLGFAVPVLAAALFHHFRRPRLGVALLTLATAFQAVDLANRTRGVANGWYLPANMRPGLDPRAGVRELRRLVRWVGQNVPKDAAIMGDFIASTSILAHSGHPIVLQPKYETASSRARIEDFYMTFFTGTFESFLGLLERYDSRYLLVDAQVLWSFRYVGGVPLQQHSPTPGTPAYAFLRRDPIVPGFELLFRSPPELEADGVSYRLYRVE